MCRKLTINCFFILGLLCPLSFLAGQGFSGSINSESTGEALPYASIYVQETGTGTVSNENGRYQLRLKPGSYTLVFQYLGYATEVRRVQSTGSFQSLDIQLRSEALELEAIEVLDGGEDASYSVIRRAIAKADYHLNQVDAYEAEVYVKGTGKVNKIPRLILAMVPKEDREEIDTSQAFITESISKISYERPNTFKQEVISIYERGEFDADPGAYIFGTFYEPEIADAAGPLSPRAFGYYRYEHEGLFVDRGQFINKIKVTPRSRGEDVFEGYIYIVEDDWSIHSLDLSVYKFGFRFDIRQTYAPIQEHVWMPVSTQVDIEGKILGIELEGYYVSTVSNYNISLNEELPGYVEVIDEKTNPEDAKEIRRANKARSYEQTLAEGGELTRKELRQLLREYEREEKREAAAPEVTSNYTFTQDSAATISDTAHWNNIRPVPLTPLEKRTYAIQDSLAPLVIASVSSMEEGNELGENELVISTGAGGTNVRSNFGRGRGLDYMPNIDFFNAVEGYAAGLRISQDYRRNKRDFEWGITPRYGFSWKRLTYKADLSYEVDRDEKTLFLKAEGGRFLRQFDEAPAMSPEVNTFTMLFNHENYLSWYERAYGKISFIRQWDADLRLSGSLAYEDRRRVFNTTDQGWFNRGENPGYRVNNPFNTEIGARDLTDLSNAFLVKLGVQWQPGQTYTVQNGDRSAVTNAAPTLSLNYFGAIPGIGSAEADFHRLEAAYQHRFQLGIRGKVDILLRGGAYLTNNVLDLPDYRHFATTEIFYTNADPIGSYRLLPYYTFSTGQEYLEFYGHYQFRKFLFSRIWSLQKQGIREDVFVNYLYTPVSDHYFELGYSIDNIFRIVRLEFVTSWQDFQYQDVGIRLSVASVFGRL